VSENSLVNQSLGALVVASTAVVSDRMRYRTRGEGWKGLCVRAIGMVVGLCERVNSKFYEKTFLGETAFFGSKFSSV
jgi:hypothetical protein